MLAELCAGYGGLGLGLELANIKTELAWYAETDPAASAVMSHHHPGVPNLGDLTRIEEPPAADIVTAGFPCQPVSAAGQRAGVEDERWLIRDVVAVWRASGARWLLLENVPGLLSANDGEAFGQVIDSLAEVGASCEWTCLRASDVGAPHRRERWFCVATNPKSGGRHGWPREEGRGKIGRTASSGAGKGPTNSNVSGLEGTESAGGRLLSPRSATGNAQGGRRDESADAEAGEHRESAWSTRGSGGLAENADIEPWEQRRVTASGEAESGRSRADAGRRGGALVAEAINYEGLGNASKDQDGPNQALRNLRGSDEAEAVQWPLGGSDKVSDQEELLAVMRQHEGGPFEGGISDPCSEQLEGSVRRLRNRNGSTDDPPPGPELAKQLPGELVHALLQLPHDAALAGGLGRWDAISAWGGYVRAVARWAVITGVLPPSPTDGGRLNPRAVEWMMGLPPGHVTGCDVSRSSQLKILGNGVVPQQAAVAVQQLMEAA